MVKLSEREENILEIIVRDYIANAIPVSSDRVCEISGMNMSSATFRSIMGSLEDAGYLKQPYTSAGRIPTQKGYRFYVDACVMQDNSTYRTKSKPSEDPSELIRHIVSKTHLFGAFVESSREQYIQMGVGETLREPEFEDRELVKEFGDFVDIMRDISHMYGNEPAIFIEEENPVPEARSLGVVVRQRPNTGMFFIVGPSRMNYERVWQTINSLESISKIMRS